MTSRERLIAATRGGAADRQPVLALQAPEGVALDAYIVPDARAADMVGSGEIPVLADVTNPLGRALLQKIPLNDLLRERPAEGEATLHLLVEQTRAEAQQALEAGADGLFYRLEGANPSGSTPMQYGGFYLERDREILDEFREAQINVLYIEGSDIYMDFVSDLPAHVLAWDTARAGVDLGTVKRMRSGALACAEAGAEILFAPLYEHLEGLLLPEVNHAAG
jgi:uroporphyrinogen-III decarboxylase